MKTVFRIEIDFTVDAYQNVSGLTEQQLADAVYEHVRPEREALAMEGRIAAIKLLAGEALDDPDDET